MSKDFRVMARKDGCVEWTEPVDYVTGTLAVWMARGLKRAEAELVENTGPRHRQVEALFTAASPVDRGLMQFTLRGRWESIRVVRIRPADCLGGATATVAALPGEEPLPTWEDCCQPPPAAAGPLVTSKEQLAAALDLPPAAVTEIQPLLAAPIPTATAALAALLEKVVHFAVALLRIPQGKEPS